MCNEFSMLLGLEGCSGGCIDGESQSSKCVCRRQNNAQFVPQIGVVKGMVVSETKRYVAPMGQFFRRGKSRLSRGRIM